MSRVKQAWQALCGTLEPEVREVEKRVEVQVLVYGEMREVAIFSADDPNADSRRMYLPPKVADWHRRLYASCEQAFAECPGAEVKKETCWSIGGKLYAAPRLLERELQPKPKRAKGAK